MNKQIMLSPDEDLFDLDVPSVERSSASEDLSRTLRAMWSTFYRNRILIIAIVVAAMLAGFGITMLMTPLYRASATIQIDQQAANVLGDKGTDSLQQSDAWSDADRFLQTQIDVLQSHAMALMVAQDLNLAKDDEFFIQMGGKPVSQPVGALSLADTRLERVAYMLSGGLKVDLPRDSRIATVSFTSPNPRLSARIANAFVSDFIVFNMRRKFSSSSYARNYLESQLSDTRTNLERSERALLDYARGANLLDVSGGIADTDGTASGSTPRSLTTSNLVELNSAYVQAQAARVAAQQHWQQAAAAPPLQLQEVLSNQAVMQLAQLKAQAQAAYQQELQRHKPDYPQMQQAAAHIAELDHQLNDLAISIRGSIKQQYETALKQEQALAAQVNGLKDSTQNEQSRSVEYNILKRAVDTNRTMYDSLLQRYAEISAQAGVAANNVNQIDTAQVPVRPVAPRPVINLALAGLLGLVAAVGFVLLRDKFDDSIRTPEDVPGKLSLTFLNSTPMIEDGITPTEALDDPRSALSEAYAALRASIELSHKDGAPRTLAVTSTRQSEGKSTTAYAIARNFARIGRSVVLVDADLRKPSLHRLLAVENSKGLSNLLAGLSTIEETLQETSVEGLGFIGSGPLPPNPAELLSGNSLPELVAELARRFDVLVIDAPPVLGLADTVLIGSTTDATLFVIEANGSHHGHAKAAVRRLMSNNIPIIGALLSKYDARKIGYGYGYGYNYAYSYSYGNDEPSAASRRWPWTRK